ncbi:MAG: hypothetical protein WKG00_01805 [Polyangiaceae bacterium]
MDASFNEDTAAGFARLEAGIDRLETLVTRGFPGVNKQLNAIDQEMGGRNP